MNAIVSVEFTIRNVCHADDLEISGLSFEELVRSLIDDEGLLSLCSDGSVTIVSIEQA